MRLLNNTIMAAFLGIGLTLGGTAPLASAANGGHQYYRDPAMSSNLRGLIDRTQTDLRAAADLVEHAKEDQRKRYSEAQGHLSTFDRKLTKGKFDKGELNKSIDKIKEILDKNVLQASTRDALMRDLEDLRIARDRRE